MEVDHTKESVSKDPTKTRTIVTWSEPPPAFREFRYHICESYEDPSNAVFNLKTRKCIDIMVYELGPKRPEIVDSVTV